MIFQSARKDYMRPNYRKLICKGFKIDTVLGICDTRKAICRVDKESYQPTPDTDTGRMKSSRVSVFRGNSAKDYVLFG